MVVLDLVFVVDCTGSMDAVIKSVQSSMDLIMGMLSTSSDPRPSAASNVNEDSLSAAGAGADGHHLFESVRFALVCFRDHPPQETTFLTRVFPFTDSIDEMQDYVYTMAAAGGGDCPEAIECALAAVISEDGLNLGGFGDDSDSMKVVVLIGDSPPHGVHLSHGDDYPDGCPLKNDPIEIVEEMANRGIVLYTVGCEPVLGQAAFARIVFRLLALKTGGSYVPLTDAESLPHVIIFGMEEELSLQEIRDSVIKEKNAVDMAHSAELEDILDLVAERVAQKGVLFNSLEVISSISKEEEESESKIVDQMMKFTNLSQMREFLAEQPLPKSSIKRRSLKDVPLFSLTRSSSSSTRPPPTNPSPVGVNAISPSTATTSSKPSQSLHHPKSTATAPSMPPSLNPDSPSTIAESTISEDVKSNSSGSKKNIKPERSLSPSKSVSQIRKPVEKKQIMRMLLRQHKKQSKTQLL